MGLGMLIVGQETNHSYRPLTRRFRALTGDFGATAAVQPSTSTGVDSDFPVEWPTSPAAGVLAAS